MPDCEQTSDEYQRKNNFFSFVDARDALDNDAQLVAARQARINQHSPTAVGVYSDTRHADLQHALFFWHFFCPNKTAWLSNRSIGQLVHAARFGDGCRI